MSQAELRPWLSVIVPTYNGAAFLQTALESIRQQGDRNIEVVVVDDGSKDDSVALAQSFSDAFQLTILPQNHVGNWVRNTNTGMTASRGEYVCWLHQDDAWEPGRLNRIKAALKEHPEIEFLFHPSWYINVDGKRVGRWSCPVPNSEGFISQDMLIKRLLIQNFIACCAPVMKRSTLDSIGLADDTLWYLADWDLWLKFCQASPAWYIPVPLSSFRVHPGSQTAGRARSIAELRQQHETVLKRYIPANVDRRTDRVARFNADLNTAMLSRSQTNLGDWCRLAWNFTSLGLFGWHRFLRDSRITDRIFSRLRGGAVFWK